MSHSQCRTADWSVPLDIRAGSGPRELWLLSVALAALIPLVACADKGAAPSSSAAASSSASSHATQPPSPARSSATTPASAAERALVGTWEDESGCCLIEFTTAGTYLRQGQFSLPTGDKVSEEDRGTYQVGAGTLTFRPTSGHYIRGNTDEGFDAHVRNVKYHFAAGANPGQVNLVMDGSVYVRP
jgi:hypothetical protein